MNKFFESPLLFAEFLVKAAAKEHLALAAGLEVSLKLIKKKAKDKIGHYQNESGPFQDWAELADATKEDRLRLGFTENDPLFRTGALKESIEHEYKFGNAEGVVGSKSPIAPYQEYGTSNIPPRPFIGPAAYESKDAIKAILGRAIMEGLTDGEIVHESLGYNITEE